MFCCADRVTGGRVHDHDAFACRGFLIDVVGTNTGSRDGRQSRVALQRFSRNFHSTSANRAVESFQSLTKLFARQSCFDFKFNPFRVGQHLQTFIGDIVQDQNSFGLSCVCVRLARFGDRGRRHMLCSVSG